MGHCVFLLYLFFSWIHHCELQLQALWTILVQCTEPPISPTHIWEKINNSSICERKSKMFDKANAKQPSKAICLFIILRQKLLCNFIVLLTPLFYFKNQLINPISIHRLHSLWKKEKVFTSGGSHMPFFFMDLCFNKQSFCDLFCIPLQKERFLIWPHKL